MSLTPLYDRVFISRAESEDKTRGGILLPDSAKDKPQIGVVYASGPGAYVHGKFVANKTVAGNRVLLSKWAGSEVELDGARLLVVKDSDILAILN